MSQLEMFEEAEGKKEVSVSDLTNLVSEMNDLKSKYELLKKESDDAYHVYTDARNRIISMLQEAKLDKFIATGIGTVSITEKLKVRVPQSIEDKEAFFGYLEQQYGKEGLLSYVNINHQSLNSLYNLAFEESKESGGAADFKLPGIGEPELELGLQFRKNK